MYLRLYLKILKRKLFSFSLIKWWVRGFGPPSPQFIKLSILDRNSLDGAPWVETGTYLGETTKFLSKNSKLVLSIEPAEILHKFASKRLSRLKNVRIISGTSEQVFESAIAELDHEANFWLDGHASGDITFGNSDVTPIVHELKILAKNLTKFRNCVIFVDDVRGFSKKDLVEDYPSKEFLIDFANTNNLTWQIEHDIFIAKKITFDEQK